MTSNQKKSGQDSVIVRMSRVLEKVIVIMGTVCTVCILILMLLTTADVVLRYIFSAPIKGAYEISEILLLSAVFLGMAFAQLHREHVKTDLFVVHLSRRTNLILETVLLFPALLMYALLVWCGAVGFWDSWTTGEYRWGLIRIPLWQARLMIPLGVSVFCLILIRDIVFNFRKLLDRGEEDS